MFLLSSELFVQCIYYSAAIILVKLPKTELQADAARALGPTGYTLLSEHLVDSQPVLFNTETIQ